ncbi:MAG: response regulator transcription factor [Candidatus Eremiobacteraeota bacterium]|nr:response regulator transcription factor [Candidatus Eremiobacteraeota bacterium]
MRVLLVEDEPQATQFIKKGLEENGFQVETAGDGETGYDWASSTAFDLIVLDLMLPRMNGLEICRRLRAQGTKARILMLTARDSIDDRVAGLESGADDYLSKPFAFRELLARLRALSRRSDEPASNEVETSGMRLNLLTRRVSVGDVEIDLSAKEFSLLEFFMRHPDQVVSRTVLVEHVWGYDFEHRSNVVEVYVRYLRQKLDPFFQSSVIETVRGVGYRLVRQTPKS